jgi:TonB-dependent starch-binding outer membrane protein SusC
MDNHFYGWFGRSKRQGASKVGSIFTMAVAMLMSLSVFAQDRTVTGKVSDAADGSGMPGVSVAVKGANKGTQTDVNGNYKLSVPNNATLTVSFVGYAKQDVAVGSRSVVDISLASETKALDEVVVVGYGTQKKKELSGTVTSVTSKDFNGGVLNNPMSALSGKVAGLVITRAGGDPNSTPTVRLRGVGSITAGSEPLYVVDGVPGVPIQNIDPNDIATMDVLRDASSAAIYGSRASNGVIMITTKRGKGGKTTVDYNAYYGVETISSRPDIYDAAGYRTAAAKLGVKIDDKGANTDWIGAITRSAAAQSHNLGFSGGSENFSYRASLGYLKQDGVVLKSGMERLSARLNADQSSMNGRLNLGINLSAITTKRNYAQNNAFVFANTFLPTDPIRNADGSYFEREASFSQNNPVAFIDGTTDEGRQNEFLANVNGRYKITDDLTFGANGSIRTLSDIRGYYQTSLPKAGRTNKGLAARSLNPFRFDQGSANVTAPPAMDQLVETTLNYNKKIGTNSIGLLAGYSYQEVTFEGFEASNNNFVTDNFGYNSLGSGVGVSLGNNAGAVNSYKFDYKLISFFGRATYNYSDKIFATVNLRRDGSTKFGANNKWGFFPSASVGVALDQFDFLKGSPVVDNMKARISWGRTGNSEGIRPYSTLQLYGREGSYYDGAVNDFLPSYKLIQNANPDLKWEVNTNYGIGLDFSLLKAKLTGSIDYYTRTTDDLLFNVAVPVETGKYVTGSILANVGSMKNSGIEASLNYLVVDGKDFQWTTVLAGAYNDNQVVSLNSATNPDFKSPNEIFVQANLGAFLRGTSAVAFTVLKPGLPVGAFWGYQVTKIDEKGEYVVKDNNGDGKTLNGDGTDFLAEDRAYIGSPQPKFTASLNNTFSYKNWSLNFLLNGRFGNKIMNTNKLILGRVGRFPEENALVGTSETTVRSNRTNSYDYYVEPGDFVRLDNFTLGYTIPVKSGILSKARVYVSGTNLFVLTSYKGIDPELTLAGQTPGIDTREFYYKTRGFNAGINLSF